MSSYQEKTITLKDEVATAQLATKLADVVQPGDTLLLSGDIGAGKTAFSRALIRACIGTQEDVPSPTFTLVQTYDAPKSEIWHCDLYRLSDPQDVIELGLEEAFDTAICLIEWPDRLGDIAPKDALSMTFVAGESDHAVTLRMTERWAEKLGQIHV